ncbi:MAG: glycosyltransferase family 2 protein [Bacteroidetes bacterium]|nr:glycosyltransferase family 2 protein [Bacteroidota bacterium]
MIKTAVVILNWNGIRFLEKFLPSLVRCTTTPETLLVVADNGSSDDSVVFIKKHYPQVRLICMDSNYGFAEGYNRALQQLDAEYFVLLNSDVEVSPCWLDPLERQMDSDPMVAACQPKILSYINKNHFEYAGAAGGFIDKHGFPFCRGRIFNIMEEDTGQYDNIREIFWASGACLIIRSELFHAAGGLDKDFFAHMEEIDLCWRLKNMGFKILAVPDSIVYHIGGGTLQMGTPQKTFLNFRNNLILIYKNTEPGKLFRRFFIRFVLDGIAGLKFLAGGEFSFFFAVLKAHFSFYKMAGSYKKVRKQMTVHLFIKYRHLEIYNGSIVYDFFLRKRKTFQDIGFYVFSESAENKQAGTGK